MEQLMQKLMMSKKIMERHDSMQRGNHSSPLSNNPSIDSFDTRNAKYNIPSEFLQEAPQLSAPKAQAQSGPPSIEAIKKSRLPDEIKRLMIEHPIEKPQQQSVGLSNDLIEKAARLMKEQSNNYQPESAKPKSPSQPKTPSTSSSDLKAMIKEAVEETLKEHGVIAESVEKSNEIFSFKVGKHIFEGKVTKIKKIS